MSKCLFLIKDEKVGFLNVIVDENVEVAKFNFGKGFYVDNPELGRIEDYSLYLAGNFGVSGMNVLDEPKFLINGLTAYNDFVSRINSLHFDHIRMEGDYNADSNLAQKSE